MVCIYAPLVITAAQTLFLKPWLRDTESKALVSQLSWRGIWAMAIGIKICSFAQSVEPRKLTMSMTLATMNGVVWHVIPSEKEKTQYMMS